MNDDNGRGDVKGNNHQYTLVVPTTLVGGVISYVVSCGIPIDKTFMSGNDVAIVITVIGTAATFLVVKFLTKFLRSVA